MVNQIVIKDRGFKSFILVNTSECSHWTKGRDAYISPFSNEKEAINELGLDQEVSNACLELSVGEVLDLNERFPSEDSEGCYIMRVM